MGLVLSAVCSVGCGDTTDASDVPDDAVLIGAALPFSGPKASTGIGIERALMLAVEDVNAAGGVDGRPLHLIVVDSNSGTERGSDALRSLLHDHDVDYLIGPEEDHLALDVVKDIKELDKMHILPSLSSPRISDSGRKGAWVRLVPSALTMGCALATKAVDDGVTTTRTIATRDDYHLELASVFGSTLSTLGGRALPTVTVADDQSSYSKQISQARRFDSAEATVMLAYPSTAAQIVGEMARSEKLRWYFSPMLRDEALLWNVPRGLLAGSTGVTPSLSQDSECELDEDDLDPDSEEDTRSTRSIECSPTVARRFRDYFSERWEGRRPLETGHFYYDAVAMLALALEASAEDGNADPTPQELLPYFTGISAGEGEGIPWDSLDEGLKLAAEGEPLHYQGTAGQYQFNERGQNIRAVVSTWSIGSDNELRTTESVLCRIPISHD